MLEALESAFNKLENCKIEDFNGFMLDHFPSKDIREKHETRLLLLQKERQMYNLQKKMKNKVIMT